MKDDKSKTEVQAQVSLTPQAVGVDLIVVRTDLNPRDIDVESETAQGRQSLSDLVESVKQYGVLVPLLVRPATAPQKDKTLGPKQDGFIPYELVAGRRRLFAAVQAGLKVVPVLVAKLDDEQARDLSVVENLQRLDLTAMYEAEYFARLSQNGVGPTEIGKRVGKSKEFVLRRLRLVHLLDEFKELLKQGKMYVWQAELVALQSGKEQKALWGRVGREDYRDVTRSNLCGRYEDTGKTIPFPLDWLPIPKPDSKLEAGKKPCIACAGCASCMTNAVALVSDLFDGADVRSLKRCTDTFHNPACLPAKLTLWCEHQVESGAIPFAYRTYDMKDADEKKLRERWPNLKVMRHDPDKAETGCAKSKVKIVIVAGYETEVGKVMEVCFGGKDCKTSWHHHQDSSTSRGSSSATPRRTHDQVLQDDLKTDNSYELEVALKVAAFPALCKAKSAALLTPLRRHLHGQLTSGDRALNDDVVDGWFGGEVSQANRTASLKKLVDKLPASKVVPMIAALYIEQFENEADKALVSYGIQFAEAKAIRQQHADKLKKGLDQLEREKDAKVAEREKARQQKKSEKKHGNKATRELEEVRKRKTAKSEAK